MNKFIKSASRSAGRVNFVSATDFGLLFLRVRTRLRFLISFLLPLLLLVAEPSFISRIADWLTPDGAKDARA
jgi:hypothetical protein